LILVEGAQARMDGRGGRSHIAGRRGASRRELRVGRIAQVKLREVAFERWLEGKALSVEMGIRQCSVCLISAMDGTRRRGSWRARQWPCDGMDARRIQSKSTCVIDPRQVSGAIGYRRRTGRRSGERHWSVRQHGSLRRVARSSGDLRRGLVERQCTRGGLVLPMSSGGHNGGCARVIGRMVEKRLDILHEQRI